MNIFILDENPMINAQYHCDQHVGKMITEHVQMMSHAVRQTTQHKDIGHGLSRRHFNHPCTVWVKTSLSNWRYLKQLTIELHKEWQYRHDHAENHHHKSFDVMMSLPEPNLPNIGLTTPAKAMFNSCKVDSVVESYRNFYHADKARFATWKKRGTPEWFNPELILS